jgi:uncharacterized protein (TIGR02996 family)
MDTRAAIHTGILHDPEPNLPREVFADYLDEFGDRPGDREWARFIRVSIERGHDNAQLEFEVLNNAHAKPGELFLTRMPWGLPAGWDATCYRKLFELRRDRVFERPVRGMGTALLVRGFVEEVALTDAEQLPDLICHHPIREAQTVGCTVRFLRATDGSPCWVAFVGGRGDVRISPPWYRVFGSREEMAAGIVGWIESQRNRAIEEAVMGRPRLPEPTEEQS